MRRSNQLSYAAACSCRNRRDVLMETPRFITVRNPQGFESNGPAVALQVRPRPEPPATAAPTATQKSATIVKSKPDQPPGRRFCEVPRDYRRLSMRPATAASRRRAGTLGPMSKLPERVSDPRPHSSRALRTRPRSRRRRRINRIRRLRRAASRAAKAPRERVWKLHS